MDESLSNFNNNLLNEQNLNTILDFANQIDKELDPDFIFNNLLFTCLGKYFTSKGAIYVSDNNSLILKTSKGLEKSFLLDNLDQYVNLNNFDLGKVQDKLKIYSNKFGFEIFDFIGNSSEILGIIFLGPKLNREPYNSEEIKILKTILNIATPAIRNLMLINKMKILNRALNFKISQMNSLVEIAKEFNLLLEIKKICKVLGYAILGNLLVSNYAISHKYNNSFKIIDGNLDNRLLDEIINDIRIINSVHIISIKDLKDDLYLKFNNCGVELIIPMIFRNKTIGFIFLGKKKSGADYNENDKEFLETIASIAVISLENAELFLESIEKQRMEEDIAIAKEIQQNLIPKKYPDSKIYKINAVNISSKQIGGDYYDVFRINEKEILFLIADVSGKGVSASLIMTNCQAFVKSLSKKADFNLSEATKELNELLFENLSGGKFVTFFWGVLNEQNKTLTYVNAGHNPPLLLRFGEIIKLEKGGILLGILKNEVIYFSERLDLKKGDEILLFTDGVTEAKNKIDQEYSDKKLEKLLISLTKNKTENLITEILLDLKTFTKEADQSDDITMLNISVIV